MLYQIYEAQRSLMEPFADFAQAASKLYSNPLSPFAQHPLAQRVSAGYDLVYRLGKDYEKPVFGITSVEVHGTPVAIQERVEIDKPFCELRRFKRFSDDPQTLDRLKGQPAVLIVAPLSGHYATLLRDTVRTMLRDHKVYITDWRNARIVPLSQGEFHLDDYVNYVQEFIRHIQAQYGNCHVISVCQPTVPVLAAVSLMASRGEPTPLTMTMMGGPIDARKSPTAVNNLAMNKSYEWFENNVIYRVPTSFPGAGRRVYPGFLQHSGFVAMNPDRHLSSHYDYFKHLIAGDDASAEAHRQFYDEYNAVLDMDADYYLETIRVVFQEFRLVNGSWDVRGVDGKLERVRPEDIRTTAHFTIEGELDDISGSGQTEAAHALCHNVPKSRQKHLEVKGAGHYGIFSGRRWREVVYPQVRDFILQFHDAPQAARAREVGGRAALPRDGGREHAMSPEAARLHAALPQTQCTRCGYPDCAGYAQALAEGSARINQCPPGGTEGVARLSALTGRPPLPLDPEHGVEGPRMMAVIDENWCIGCTLCLDACPTDAILGGNKRMHTVIERYCTGCELCVPVCPVDCIYLENFSGTRTGWQAWSQEQADEALARHTSRTARRARESVENAERLERKAQAKLADLPAHTHGAEGDELARKKAVIEAALARARAKRGT